MTSIETEKTNVPGSLSTSTLYDAYYWQKKPNTKKSFIKNCREKRESLRLFKIEVKKNLNFQSHSFDINKEVMDMEALAVKKDFLHEATNHHKGEPSKFYFGTVYTKENRGSIRKNTNCSCQLCVYPTAKNKKSRKEYWKFRNNMKKFKGLSSKDVIIASGAI